MSEWISVEDRLPELKVKGFYYCIIAQDNGVVKEAMFNTLINKFMNRNFSTMSQNITHWMPLPEAPECSK